MTRQFCFIEKSVKSLDEMVNNEILFHKLFWPTVRKNCSRDRGKFLKFEAEGREFSKILRSQEQFIQTAKGQNNFWNRMLFKLILEVLSNTLEQLYFKLEKIIGIWKPTGKKEQYICN